MTLSTSEVEVALDQIMSGFKELGFECVYDYDAARRGVMGVYLVKRETNRKELTEDDMFCRVIVTNTERVGQTASIDFRAGPCFWLTMTQKVES